MPSHDLDTEPYLEAIVADIKAAMDRQGLNATGRAQRLIKVRNKRNVIAPGYVSTLFQGVGRRPSSRIPPIQNLERWIQAKGIQWSSPTGRAYTVRQMAFLIANTIKERGTRIFRDGRRGIQIDRIIEKNNDIYMPQIARSLRNTYVEAFNLTIVT